MKDQYIFGGTLTRTAPFEVSTSGAVYLGNTEIFSIEIAQKTKVGLTIPGSTALGTDLDPVLTLTTQLADLNGGQGVPAGQFSVTDRGGNSATIAIGD